MPPTKTFSAWPFAAYSAEVDALGNSLKFEGKQCCDVDSIPCADS